ncbi:MAG: hypothetical protein ACJ74O_13450 [Frankiaceae bacterium]
MGDFVFNIAKGKARWYLEQAGVGNQAIIVIPLEAAGLEADGTLKDYANVSALLAGTSNAQTTMGRKTITTPGTVTVDNVNDRVDTDVPDQTWAAATGNAVGKLILAYDPDTTTGTDTTLVPVIALDFVATPDGTNILWSPNAAGVYRAQ